MQKLPTPSIFNILHFRPKLNVSIHNDATNSQNIIKDLDDKNLMLEKSMVQELLDWCYDNTLINQMKQPDLKTNDLLHWACEKGFFEVVECLLKENRFKDVNCLGSNDETPLHKASQNGHIEIVKFLIQRGAKVNAKNSTDSTPLHLLSESFKIDSQLSQDFIEVAKILIENGAEINIKNSNGKTPLYLAVNHGRRISQDHPEKSKLCLEMGKLLIEKGAHMNTKCNQGYSILHSLALNLSIGSLWYGKEITKLLIAKGEDVNAKSTNRQKTPLHVALKSDNEEYARFLIENGADLNAVDSLGETPLQITIKKGQSHQQIATEGQENICQLLISLGANIELKDSDGNTSLLNAVKNIENHFEHLDIVKMLIDKGASVNTANKENNVPLHYAKSKYVAELLLKNGAKTDIKNNQGQTPSDVAFQNKAQEVVKVIIQHETRATDRELNNCIICFNARNGTFAFLPCGHARTCEDCCKNILQPANPNPECPTCRQQVTIYQKIFT